MFFFRNCSFSWKSYGIVTDTYWDCKKKSMKCRISNQGQFFFRKSSWNFYFLESHDIFRLSWSAFLNISSHKQKKVQILVKYKFFNNSLNPTELIKNVWLLSRKRIFKKMSLDWKFNLKIKLFLFCNSTKFLDRQ